MLNPTHGSPQEPRPLVPRPLSIGKVHRGNPIRLTFMPCLHLKPAFWVLGAVSGQLLAASAGTASPFLSTGC